MEFLNYIYGKLKMNNILHMIFFLALGSVLYFTTFYVGFSSNENFSIGIRGTGAGLPVPNFVVSSITLIVAFLVTYQFISSIKSVIKNTEYNKFISSAEEIGNVQYIGDLLNSLEKCKYIKGGELRFNNQLFFFMKDTDIWIIKTDNITSVEPVCKKKDSKKEYFIRISHRAGTIVVNTKKDTSLILAQDIVNAVNSTARTQEQQN